MREYLVEIVTTVPPGTPCDEVTARRLAEARQVAELVRGGRILRLWRAENEPKTVGLWRARSIADLHAEVLDTLPLRPWMTISVTPLTSHPNDPLTSRQLAKVCITTLRRRTFLALRLVRTSPGGVLHKVRISKRPRSKPNVGNRSEGGIY